MPPEDLPRGWEIPDEPYEGEPPEIFIPEGRARKYRVKPTPLRHQVESDLPLLRNMRQEQQQGSRWDFESESARQNRMWPIGNSRREYRDAIQEAKQFRHEDIIRLRNQPRHPEDLSPPTFYHPRMDNPWDTRPYT